MHVHSKPYIQSTSQLQLHYSCTLTHKNLKAKLKQLHVYMWQLVVICSQSKILLCIISILHETLITFPLKLRPQQMFGTVVFR